MPRGNTVKKPKVADDLPHNSDAERAVLGSAILAPSATLNVISSLNEDDFFEGRHQIIYRAINILFERKSVVDILTVSEVLDNLKELENIGGVSYLQQCADSMVALSSLEFYINIVNDQAVLRRMLTTIRNINRSYLENEVENVNDFIIASENSFKDSISRRKISNFKTTKEVTQVVKNEIDSMVAQSRNSEERDLIGWTTGFSNLNALTQGFQPQQLIIVAGRPGLGKTALALNFAFKVSRYHDIPVGIFSLEMSSELLVRRLVASSACVDLKKIATGNLNTDERNKVASAIKEVGETKIFIDDSPGLRLTDIIAKSKKLQASNPDLGMIIIDYLGLVQLGGKVSRGQDSRQEEVRKISLALKDLSRDLKVPVIVLSQLSRDVEKRDSKRPMLSDLRDSGSIEQDADIVMLLYREDYYGKEGRKKFSGDNKVPSKMSDNERAEMSEAQRSEENLAKMPGSASYVEVNVAKNRNGQVGKAGLFFFKSYGRFDQPSKDWEQQMLQVSENQNPGD